MVLVVMEVWAWVFSSRRVAIAGGVYTTEHGKNMARTPFFSLQLEAIKGAVLMRV